MMVDMTDMTVAPNRRPGVPADLSLLAIAVIWGASYPVTKIALASAPALVLIFYRFSATACIMAWAARRALAAASREDMLRAAASGGILCAIFMAEIGGLARTTATNTALIISLCTVMTSFLEYGLARRLPPGQVLLGGVIACAGVGLLAGRPDTLSPGDLLILLAAGLRACMVVATRQLMATTALPSTALTALQALSVSVLMLAILVGTTGLGALVVHATVTFWSSVTFLILFCTIAAFYVQNAAVRRTSPTRVAFLMGTEPLLGFALAHVMLSEPATPAMLLGAVLILTGTATGVLGAGKPADHFA